MIDFTFVISTWAGVVLVKWWPQNIKNSLKSTLMLCFLSLIATKRTRYFNQSFGRFNLSLSLSGSHDKIYIGTVVTMKWCFGLVIMSLICKTRGLGFRCIQGLDITKELLKWSALLISLTDNGHLTHFTTSSLQHLYSILFSLALSETRARIPLHMGPSYYKRAFEVNCAFDFVL